MKMKLRLIVILVLVLTVFSSYALADVEVAPESLLNQVIEAVDEANEEIAGLVDEAIVEADLAKLECKSPDGYEKELDKIISELIAKTEKIASKTIKSADKEGIAVYCEWVEVEIHDRLVWIDPLIVGGF